MCPKSKVRINPILPTKYNYLNIRAITFNKLIFRYIDTCHDNFLQYVNFSGFLDGQTWLLKEDLGRFNNRQDLIHLGSSGIRLLVNIIKERVCGSRVDGRSYSGVGSVNRGRVQNGMKRVGNVTRAGGIDMMNTATTNSGTLLAPSQQIQP